MSSNSYSVLDLFLNFTNQFSDSFLYAYILQIILIIYMYNCAGSGRYWKILLYGSIFGMIGAVVEHAGTAWLETIGKDGNHYSSKAYYCYFLSEIGWIASEFSIPYLNLIKLNTLTQTKLKKIINITVITLFVLFSGSRLAIGYLRLSYHCLYNTIIYHAHGVAFGITAVADGLLSVLIFIELNKSAKKTKEKDGETFNLLSSFKKSSLFILFIVDLMSVILAILSIFIGIGQFGEKLNKLMKPFHALKSNFLLILAIDAFVFKMRASVDGSYIVSRYLQKQSKLCSNQGDISEEANFKKFKSFTSSQLPTMNTITNGSVINITVAGANNTNTNTTYTNNNNNNNNNNVININANTISNNNNNNNNNDNNNNNNNNNKNKDNANDTLPYKGHRKTRSSVSDLNYYLGSSDIINNMVPSPSSFHSSASSTTLNEMTTRAYLKGKKSLSNRSDFERNNNSFLTSPISISSMTPLNLSYNNANYMKSNTLYSGNRSNNNNNTKIFSASKFKKNFG